MTNEDPLVSFAAPMEHGAERGEPTLHHEDEGSGIPVVLVHGWSFSSAVFSDEIGILSRTHRVIAPDLRGHGRSSAGAFTLRHLAEDVARLVERLALDRPILAGWSLGAQVVLAALPLVRARVSAAVLVSGTPRFTVGDGWTHGLPARSVEVLAQRVRRDPSRALARFFDGMFAEGELDEAGRGRVARARAAIPLPDPEAAAAGLDLLAREDLRPGLPRLGVPTLLVHGERDPICPPAASRAMAEAIPGARLCVLPGVGHAPFLSRPGALAAALQPFLAARA